MRRAQLEGKERRYGAWQRETETKRSTHRPNWRDTRSEGAWKPMQTERHGDRLEDGEIAPESPHQRRPTSHEQPAPHHQPAAPTNWPKDPRQNPQANNERIDSSKDQFHTVVAKWRKRRYGNQSNLITDPETREIRQGDDTNFHYSKPGKPQLQPETQSGDLLQEARALADTLINRITEEVIGHEIDEAEIQLEEEPLSPTQGCISPAIPPTEPQQASESGHTTSPNRRTHTLGPLPRSPPMDLNCNAPDLPQADTNKMETDSQNLTGNK